jgi:putative transposase
MCRDWAISIRRACGALNFERSTYDYTSRRADQAGLERRIREICETRVRYGYRRVHVLLEREGWAPTSSEPIAFTETWACSCAK